MESAEVGAAEDETATGEGRRKDKFEVWGDLRKLIRADWQAAVDAGETKLSYRDWFAQQFPMGEGK